MGWGCNLAGDRLFARPTRHLAGDRWFVDETYVKVNGIWSYVYPGRPTNTDR